MMRVKSMDQLKQAIPNHSGSESQDFKDTVALVNADHAKMISKMSHAVSQSEKTAYFAESQQRSLKENVDIAVTIE